MAFSIDTVCYTAIVLIDHFCLQLRNSLIAPHLLPLSNIDVSVFPCKHNTQKPRKNTLILDFSLFLPNFTSLSFDCNGSESFESLGCQVRPLKLGIFTLRIGYDYVLWLVCGKLLKPPSSLLDLDPFLLCHVEFSKWHEFVQFSQVFYFFFNFFFFLLAWAIMGYWQGHIMANLWSVWIEEKGGRVEQSRVDQIWHKINFFLANTTLLPFTPPPSLLYPNRPLGLSFLWRPFYFSFCWSYWPLFQFGLCPCMGPHDLDFSWAQARCSSWK